MYEEKSSIDWKGLFLKVLIVFLVVVIGVKGYTTFKGKDTKKNTTTTETVSEAKTSSTFTANMEKLKAAGAKYFEDNKDKLPKTSGTTVMVSLNDLVNGGYLENLSDEDGKICSGDSSYVTATLEGTQIKQKSNLVCGDASSYSMAYMDGYAGTDNNYSYTTTSNGGTSSSSSSKGTSSCSASTCTPRVSVHTNVSQKVSIGSGKTSTSSNSSSNRNNSNSNRNNNSSNNNNNTRYYTVYFDKNGGRTSYASQTVRAYDTVENPGSNSKNSCSFIGWYYNGYKYDFNTPVTSDMTLIANYSCSNNNYYYDDNYDDDYYDYVTTKTHRTTVYTMGWAEYGTNNINITHTLRLPDYLDKRNVKRVRIKNISYSGAIDTMSKVRTYNSNHADTFIYSRNGWESNINSASSLSTI